MQGLLADVNVQGHLRHLVHMLDRTGLREDLEIHLNLRFVTFPDLGLPPDLNDRDLWNFCQLHQWVLFTENRNDDGPNSLKRTLDQQWRPGHLPVLTLGNKARFMHNRIYAEKVAADTADLLFSIEAEGIASDRARIYVPHRWP